jgi:long-chain acyl-CoA synthetase
MPVSAYERQPWQALYQVPNALPLPTASVIDTFEAITRRAPESPAIYFFDEVISFARLNRMAESFAAQLADWGIGKGDRVALWLQNDPEFAAAQLGAWKCGGIVVPLSPMFKQKELRYHLDDSGARVLVAGQDLPAGVSVEHGLSRREFRQLEAKADKVPVVRVPVSPEDIAYLVYTSGTTGNPKGAMLLHRNVAFNVEVFRHWMRLGPGDVIHGIAPLFHVTGLVPQLSASAMLGLPLILYHRFEAAETIRLARKWKATFAVAAITAYLAMLNEPPSAGGFLEKCYSGGAPVAPSIPERFEKRFGTRIHNIYGLTESTSPSHATPLGVRGPVDPASGALSIGIPIPNLEAKIVAVHDPGQVLPAGEAGELVMRGPMMFAGYWNKPEETTQAHHDGWFKTGDVAIMDEQGWFYLVDRKKDLIVASGFKVWPREVEDVLYQHPAVKEAAVIGVPDEYRGETVKAFVALRDDWPGPVAGEDLIRFCRDRMAAYKYPRQVEFVTEVPKTATGKFLRRALKKDGA